MKKLGEVFDFHGTSLKVVRETYRCNGCYFDYPHSSFCNKRSHPHFNEEEDDDNLNCGGSREDRELIIFIKHKPFIFGK